MTGRPPGTEPTPVLDPRFSSPRATPIPWSRALAELTEAEVYWLSTVRPDGRPHVTPIAAVVEGEAVYFCTGPTERKARNLERNRYVVITTGSNTIQHGVDVVIEGDAKSLTDEEHLRRLADAYLAKYGDLFRFDVRDGAFWSEDGGRALVFMVAPRKGFAFGKGDEFSQTRWRF
jgi:nitroimidazol reductase NimA-like FMN-containing flavoprotein (pyridoxamine 5'-phosphate oxidase superfamily)